MTDDRQPEASGPGLSESKPTASKTKLVKRASREDLSVNGKSALALKLAARQQRRRPPSI